MKSKRVTSTWEFYRDNCDGFKEPVRRELRKLDGYVSNIEADNEKLRELVRELWNCAASLAEDSIYHIEGAVCGCGISCVVNGEDCSAYKLRDRMRELGVEV